MTSSFSSVSPTFPLITKSLKSKYSGKSVKIEPKDFLIIPGLSVSNSS